jgi:hypothetical protein
MLVVLLGLGVLTIVAAEPAAAQIAAAGESWFTELLEFAPWVAGVGVIVFGAMVAAGQMAYAVYGGGAVLIGGTIMSLADEIMSLLGWA